MISHRKLQPNLQSGRPCIFSCPWFIEREMGIGKGGGVREAGETEIEKREYAVAAAAAGRPARVKSSKTLPTPPMPLSTTTT